MAAAAATLLPVVQRPFDVTELDDDDPILPSSPPRGDVVLVSDATADGATLASALQDRGFEVVITPLALLEARVLDASPRVMIIDIDQPGAFEAVERARELNRGARAKLLCISDPGRADAVRALGAAGRSFARPVDIDQIVEHVASIAEPLRKTPQARESAPEASSRPDTVPPPTRDSESPEASDYLSKSDPFDIGSILPFGLPFGEDAVSAASSLPTQLSPELEQLMLSAERRVGTQVHISSMPPPEEDDLLLPPELLVGLDEPLEAEEEEGRTGSDGGGRTPPQGLHARPPSSKSNPSAGARLTADMLEDLEPLTPREAGGLRRARTMDPRRGPVTAVENAQAPQAPLVEKTPATGMPSVRASSTQAGRRVTMPGSGRSFDTSPSFSMRSSVPSSGGLPPPPSVPSVTHATSVQSRIPVMDLGFSPSSTARPPEAVRHGPVSTTAAPEPSRPTPRDVSVEVSARDRTTAGPPPPEPARRAAVHASEPARRAPPVPPSDLPEPIRRSPPVTTTSPEPARRAPPAATAASPEPARRAPPAAPVASPEPARRAPPVATVTSPEPARRAPPVAPVASPEPARRAPPVAPIASPEPARPPPRPAAMSAEPARRPAPASPPVDPEPARSAATSATSAPPIPTALGEGDAAIAIARAITLRATGSLAIATDDGVRRVVLQDGDIMTAASWVADETLLAFLAWRGDVERDLVSRFEGKLPPFGRYAGAALIAHGHLGQDDLWPVLRAHAEWIIGQAVLAPSGTCTLEAEPPARLKAEPNVFGGATGAEVFVETVRRVIAPEVATPRIGGPGARLGDGPNAALLGECALRREDEERIRSARGHAASALLGDAEPEMASVLYALSCLGVIELFAAAGPAHDDEEPHAGDPLDEEAVRQRVRARVALVEDGDYFSVLGIPHSATSYEIRRAYLELRRAFEPARLLTAATADLRDDVRLVIEVLDEAFDILREPHRRERYRKAIESPGPA